MRSARRYSWFVRETFLPGAWVGAGVVVDASHEMGWVESRQKSYADKRRKPLEFQPNDIVFLKKVRTVAYKVKLLAEPSHIHYVFHISQLKKSALDAPQVMSWSNVPLDQNVTFEEGPVCILEREEKMLPNRQVPLLKVKWQHHGVEEATWELEYDMRKKYPHLF
ncbi:hypothetical protein ACLB2K_017330 [Fragaria x ananassa]